MESVPLPRPSIGPSASSTLVSHVRILCRRLRTNFSLSISLCLASIGLSQACDYSEPINDFVLIGETLRTLSSIHA